MNLLEHCTETLPHTAAVLLDMDGVLCENTFRTQYNDKRDYDSFASSCQNAAPKMDFVCLARALQLDNVAVFILTARSESLREVTTRWLKEKGVRADYLIMRPKANGDKDHILKKKMLTALKHAYKLGENGAITPLLAVDDDEKIVKMYRDNGLFACLPEQVPDILI